MSSQIRRIRYLGSPYAEQLFDAHLDDIVEQPGPRGMDVVFTLRLLRLITPLEQRVVDGQPCEVARGERTRCRLRFHGATFHWRNGAFEHLDELSPDHGARRVFGVSRFRDSQDGEFYWIVTATEEPGDLAIRAKACVLEPVESAPEPVEIVRRWANPPSSGPYLPPRRPVLHHRYGGDPITIRLGKRVLHHRLFIGGLHHQRDRRPGVDAVLNLCGLDNPWCERYGRHPDDRFSYRGEGPHGMSVEDLLEEAEWVAARLRMGNRVLVHCYAGMNRSATVCCAALMLLEGIPAEESLARVRQRHPVALPDPYHWFILQWLSNPPGAVGAGDTSERASLLREVSSIG